MKERERDASLLPKCLQQLRLGQLTSGAWNLGSRDSATSFTTCCLPRCTCKGSWDQELRLQSRFRILVSQKIFLTTQKTFTPNLLLNLCFSFFLNFTYSIYQSYDVCWICFSCIHHISWANHHLIVHWLKLLFS